MISASKMTEKFTYEIKQSIYQIGTNNHTDEIYDPIRKRFMHKGICLAEHAEEEWIKETIKNLYHELEIQGQ